MMARPVCSKVPTAATMLLLCLCLAHVYSNQTTAEGWHERKQQRERDKLAMNSILRDERVDGPTKKRVHSEYILKYGRTLFSCPQCWLLPGLCVCKHMAPVRTNTRVLIHVHPSEWGKSTNTGTVASLSMPNTCQVLLKGYDPHEDMLQQVIQDPQVTTAVLWPGERSILPAELKSIAQQQTGGRVAIIAVDATWDAACRMKTSYPPNTLQVRLGPNSTLREGAGKSLLRPVRQYRGDLENNGRVSTLEAIACLLYELEGDQQLLEGLLGNLRIKVDAMLTQKLRQPVYGTVAASLPKEAREAAKQFEPQLQQTDREQRHFDTADKAADALAQ